MTENHNYSTPPKGTTDWHIPLNDNFRAIDADMEVRDANSNRGNYTPLAGAKFLATDTGDVYLGDGSTWNAIGTIQPDTSGTGGSATDIHASKDGLVVPVGDGLGADDGIDPATTDTPVQDAIDLIGRDNEGAVLLPPETIQETGPIVGGKDKILRGWGMLTSEIEFTSDTADGIAQDPNVNNDWWYSSVEDLRLNGGGGGRSSGSAIHFEHFTVPVFNLDRVDIPDWTGPDPVVWADQGGHWFDSTWGLVKAGNAGSTGTVFQWDHGGSPNRYDHLTLNTSEDADGQAMEINADMQASIGSIEVVVQGSDFAAIEVTSNTGPGMSVDIGTINYESEQSVNAFPDSAIVHKSGPGYLNIEKIQVQSTFGTVNHGFTDRSGQGNWNVGNIEQIEAPSAFAISPLRIHKPMDSNPATYGGNLDDLTDNTSGVHEEAVFFTGESYLYRGEPLRGTTTLSGGTATIQTGITDQSTTFEVALGASTSGAKVSARSYYDGSEHLVELYEDGSSVGNPTVNYHITARSL
jgi:hypothetical protein